MIGRSIGVGNAGVAGHLRREKGTIGYLGGKESFLWAEPYVVVVAGVLSAKASEKKEEEKASGGNSFM